MWGFYNSKNKSLAERIFNLLVNKTLADEYKKLNDRWSDQFFLRDYVYGLIKNDSLIHDSYLCCFYKDSVSFPTKRVGNCFVGQIGNCNLNSTSIKCPIECRPKAHLDWINC